MSGQVDNWWRRAVLYQVYLRSFQDSDGDGVGDLQGLMDRLDYLKGGDHALGVDAIWLSPVSRAGSADFGYDPVDLCEVDAVAGDLATFDRLVAACHARGIRVVLDLVVNHTSDEHPWFVESRTSRASAKRDWYIWHDAAEDGGPPNAWRSVFGGSMWTADERSGQYYLHSYFAAQPDLNWRNPQVVGVMQEVIRFWLQRGVDGLRLDAVARLVKDANLTDNPDAGDSDVPPEPQTYLHPDLADAVTAIRAVVDEFPDRLGLGEVYAPAHEAAVLLGTKAQPRLHMVLNHNLVRRRPHTPLVPWDAEAIALAVREDAAALPHGALSCWALGNHDVSRFVSRHDGEGQGAARARAAALLLLGLRGVPCIYYGDELGMGDAVVGTSGAHDAIGRDPARAPMPWDASALHGFTTGTPWLPFASARSALEQQGDPDSLLTLYRDAIRVRRDEPALVDGDVAVAADGPVCVLSRHLDGATDVVIAVNTASTPQRVTTRAAGRLLLATDRGVAVQGDVLLLPGLAAAWVASGGGR
jgi:alpha-glucosidase